MRIIVAGSRDFNNYEVLDKILSCEINPPFDTIISGDARGADSLGAEWADKHGIPVKYFPAYWETYGKGAGFIRNAEMGEYADMLIAFWDGKSKGTAHMIKTMKMNKKPYLIFNYQGEEIERG